MAETTGLKTVTRLRKFINGKATTETKSNVSSDPDYIAPYNDVTSCPLYLYNTPTPPSPTPTPSPTPGPPTTSTTTQFDPGNVPELVAEEEAQPDATSCNPCITKNVANSQCRVYHVQNRSQVLTSHFQITDCKTGKIIQKSLVGDAEKDVESLSIPFHNSGPNIFVEDIEPADGFSDIDLNKFHYLTKNCSNNLEKRIIRHTSQLNTGQVVKTENSSCCWEILNQESPQQAHNVVFDSTNPIYNDCNTCCTGSVSIPDTNAVLTGKTVIEANCSNSINQTGIFTVTKAGDVRIVMEVDVISGQYIRAAGRLYKTNDNGTSTQYVSFPSNPSSFPPYIVNGIEQSSSTIESRKLRLEEGVYKLQIDPPICASGAFGSVYMRAIIA